MPSEADRWWLVLWYNITFNESSKALAFGLLSSFWISFSDNGKGILTSLSSSVEAMCSSRSWRTVRKAQSLSSPPLFFSGLLRRICEIIVMQLMKVLLKALIKHCIANGCRWSLHSSENWRQTWLCKICLELTLY